ncbi:TRAP transporter substrate-binding protein [Hydrogenophaga sp.]|uniref:TRAP transporter substrate-binding protein n=1 Tax=Hydrogenophaga sp. TaxID=1904254 RepID=UPI003F71B0A4
MAADPAKPLEITAVTQVGPLFPQFTKVDIPILRDQLQAQSGGKIRVKLYSYPEMNVGGPEVLRLVRSGQIDIAAVTLATASGDVPLLDGFDLPGLNNNIAQARKVADALAPYADERLRRLGVKLVATYTYTPQMLFCNRPVTGLSSLRGMKVRVAGPALGALVESFGGQPVSLAFGEVYTALERKTVDCAITGVGSGNSAKWTEVATSLHTRIISGATAGYLVNLSWWTKLDPALRTMIEDTMLKVQEAQWKLAAEATQDGIDCNAGIAATCQIHTLASRPMTTVPSNPADDAAVKAALSSRILPEWVKRCGANCGEIFNRVVSPISGVTYAP